MTPDSPATEALASRWQYGRIVPMPEAVPVGWDFVRLTDVARLESGHTPSRKHPEYWEGDIPWVSLHDSKVLDRREIRDTAQTIGELGLANSSARRLPAGTVVFSRTATVGKATILAREMATSQDFANYICGPRIWNQYLLHLLRFLQPEWNRLMAGSTHNTIYMPVFEGLQALLPPLSEQRKIAAILSSVDDAIEATQAVIDQLDVVKKAMMADLLTRGLPGKHTRFKQTEIGEVPEDWEVVRLGDAATTIAGGTPSRDDASNYGGGVPWVKSGEVDNPNIYETEETISEHGLANSSAKWVEPDAVLIAMYGATAGKVGRLRIRATTNQAVCAVASRECSLVTNEFLYWTLCHAAPRLLRTLQGSGQPNLNAGMIRAHHISVPPFSEQVAMTEALDAAMGRLSAEAEALDALKQCKTALMSVLLTGEVRVKQDEETA